MKTALKIILHLAGFPLLIALVIVFTLPVITAGITYGVMVFIGVILTLVMALIYFLVFFLMAKSGKKSVYTQTLVSIIVAVVCLCGLWAVIDIALPDFLAEATSKTIFYEDLADDYKARAEVNQNLLDEFIKRNVANGALLTKDEIDACITKNVQSGKLNNLSEAAYLQQGAKNKEVQKILRDQLSEPLLKEGARNKKVAELLTAKFKSIDKDGYVTFVGPWLDLANSKRMTIPALIHLIINKRDTEGLPFPIDEADDPVMWSILDMLGEPMEFDLGPDGMDVIPEQYMAALTGPLVQGILKGILTALTRAVEDPDVIGSPIYFVFDKGVISLVPSNESRGVLDYQSTAWLNSNGLIFAIVSLFSVRKLFLIFAGVLVITTYLIGLLREGEDKKSKVKARKGKKSGAVAEPEAVGPVLNMKKLTVDCYKPYDPSYVVVTNGSFMDSYKTSFRLAADAAKRVNRT